MTVIELINSPTKTNSKKNIFFADQAKHVVIQKQSSGHKSRNLLMKNPSISLQEFYFMKGQVDEDEKKGLVTTTRTATTTTTTTNSFRKGGKKQLELPSNPSSKRHYGRSLSNDDKYVSNNYKHQLSTLEACCNMLACCFLWCV